MSIDYAVGSYWLEHNTKDPTGEQMSKQGEVFCSASREICMQCGRSVGNDLFEQAMELRNYEIYKQQ